MVYKGFFGPVLDFQKKLGFRVLDLGNLRVFRKYVSIEAQDHPQHFSQANKHSSNNLRYECKSLKNKDKEIFQKIINVCLKAFLVKSEGSKC